MILGLCFLDWVSNCEGHITLSGGRGRGSYGWSEVDVFWPSQFERDLDPSSVQGFLPGLGTVGSTYGEDLCSEGNLNLGHADVVTMLFNLIPSFLGLYLCLLSLSPQLLSLIFEFQGFFQFLLKGYHLLLRISQLILCLAQKLPLLLGLPFSALQGRISTLFGLFLLSQFFP